MATTEDLEREKEELRTTHQALLELMATLKQKKLVVESLQALVDTDNAAYVQKLVAFVRAQLAQDEQTWCTGCGSMGSTDSMQLLFTGGNVQSGGTSRNPEYSHQQYLYLHRLCPRCSQTYQKKIHGGTYLAKFEGERCYALNDDRWQQVENKYTPIPTTPPACVLLKVAAQHEIPTTTL